MTQEKITSGRTLRMALVGWYTGVYPCIELITLTTLANKGA